MNFREQVGKALVELFGKPADQIKPGPVEVAINPGQSLRSFQQRSLDRPATPYVKPHTEAKFTFTNFHPPSKPLQNENNPLPPGAGGGGSSGNTIDIEMVVYQGSPAAPVVKTLNINYNSIS